MDFLGMGPLELMLILVLALVVFGPGKLPEIAGQVGKAVRDFRRTTSELSGEFNRTLSLEVEERKSSTATVAPPAEPTAAPSAGMMADAPPVASPSLAPVAANGVGSTATLAADESTAASPSTAVAAPLASGPTVAPASSAAAANGDSSGWQWEPSAPSTQAVTAAAPEPMPAGSAAGSSSAAPPDSNGTAARRAARKRDFDPDLAPPY